MAMLANRSLTITTALATPRRQYQLLDTSCDQCMADVMGRLTGMEYMLGRYAGQDGSHPSILISHTSTNFECLTCDLL